MRFRDEAERSDDRDLDGSAGAEEERDEAAREKHGGRGTPGVARLAIVEKEPRRADREHGVDRAGADAEEGEDGVRVGEEDAVHEPVESRAG